MRFTKKMVQFRWGNSIQLEIGNWVIGKYLARQKQNRFRVSSNGGLELTYLHLMFFTKRWNLSIFALPLPLFESTVTLY